MSYILQSILDALSVSLERYKAYNQPVNQTGHGKSHGIHQLGYHDIELEE